MNSFDQCNQVEAIGLSIVMPYLQKMAYQGRIVTLYGNANAKELQKHGDVLLQLDEQRFLTIDLKIEQRHTGNFFIETWSNKSRFTLGWVHTCSVDRILYLFLDRPENAYSINVKKLKSWLFGVEQGKSRLGLFKEVQQSKYNQLNDTWGLIVPILRLTDQSIAKLVALNCEQAAA